MPKLIRITTVPVSLQVLLKGQMKFMKQHGFDVTMISAAGEEVKSVKEQEECVHIAVPFTRKITPWKDLVCLLKIIRIFKKIKPDIVHTHTPKAGLIGMLAAKIAGVPLRLHTIAGLPWMESSGSIKHLLKFIEKLTAMAASRVYPNSLMLERFLAEQQIAKGKMKVLGKGSSNGIDSNFFSLNKEINEKAAALRKEKGTKQEAWVWIFVGRLVKDKGIGELLDAFCQLNKNFPDDQLWLLGKEEPELDPLNVHHKNMLHAHPAIHCWGFQKDIRPYLAASQVLAFPSYREGFPNVPMQAGLMGCMLLLSDINGCNEIVQHGTNGLLIPVKNAMALTEAMTFIRNAPAEREAFAEAIKKKIKENFDQQYLWDLILQEYHQLLLQKRIAF